MHIKITKERLIGVVNILTILGAVIFLSIVGYRDFIDAKGDHVATAVAQQVSATEKRQVKNAEYYGAKRAQIAMQEYQKGITESKPGCNCGPEVDKYTEGNAAQWCTMFASWVTKEAGSPVTSERTKGWRITNSRDFSEYLKKNGTWYSREEVIQNKLEPKVGDFIVFWRGNYEEGLGHVDIVVDPGTTPGYANTVGGNLHDKVVLRDFPYRDNYGFLGFGRPEKF